MGDTVIKGFSDLTIWIGSLTVLPGESGVRASSRQAMKTFTTWARDSAKNFTGPGILGAYPRQHEPRVEATEYENRMLDKLADRLGSHIGDDDQPAANENRQDEDDLMNDIQFYHYVLARECRNVQKNLSTSPPKEYTWEDWEYYLKLMGNEEDPVDFPGQRHPDILVPDAVRAPKGSMSGQGAPPFRANSQGSGMQSGSDEKDESSYDEPQRQLMDGNVDRQTSMSQHLHSKRQQRHKRKLRNPDDDYTISWSWLSQESPLMSQKSEAEWILERLSAALERELNRQRKGYRRKPPVSRKDAKKRDDRRKNEESQENGAEGAARRREQTGLDEAAKSEH